MQTISLTRAGIALPVVAYLQRRGARIDRLLAAAGLPSWIFTNAEALIPTAAIARFFDRSALTEGIENLGLRAGEQAHITALGTLGRLISGAPTLHDALRAEIHNHRAFSSHGRIWLTYQRDEAQICQAFTKGFDHTWRQADHYLMMLVLNILRLAAGPTWRPAKVEFQTGECPALHDVDTLSSAQLSFDQPATAITFPRSLLEARLRRPATPSQRVPVGIGAWRASAPVDGIARSMVQIVRTLSWEGYPSIDLTASVLGITVRTLQRHLAAAGLTHESLVGQARFEAAVTQLEGTDAKIVDIALDLGYSDHAHFTRAFRRWAACSPQEYRRRCRDGSPAESVAGLAN